MKERIRLLCQALRQGSSAVTAIVTGCRGATPRSPGALLVLTAETALGTVGGGQAEHDIIGPAMEMLRGKDERGTGSSLEYPLFVTAIGGIA